MFRRYMVILVGISIILGLYLTSLYNFLFFMGKSIPMANRCQ
jgi:purine-cytosine permease-like protein